MIHGDKDELVPIDHSRKMLAALQKVGATCKLVVVEGAGHGYSQKQNQEIVIPAMLSWFDKYLGGEGAAMNDAEKLQGTWLTVSQVADGKTLVDEKTPPKAGPAVKLAYEGDKWMVKVGDKTVAWGKFKIDQTKTPKEIDILDETGTKNDKTKLGIYEFDGDTYRYCLAARRQAAADGVHQQSWQRKRAYGEQTREELRLSCFCIRDAPGLLLEASLVPLLA